MFKICLICVLCLSVVQASRILVCVPSPSISHQVVFYPLIKELLKRGHEIVFLTTDAMYPKGQAPANLTEIDSHDASYKGWRDNIMDSKTTTGAKEDHYMQVMLFFKNVGKSFESQILTPEFQEVLKKNTHFDLLIIEAISKITLSLSHVFKAPVIMMSSFGSISDNYELIGAPKHPRLLYPYCFHQKLNNMTILDKLRVLWHVYNVETIFDYLVVEENRIIKRLFGPDTPNLQELGSNVHLLLMNVYPIWERNRPVPPSVIFIGGIHQKPENELPKDIRTYLDSSKNGVVYFCFGTNVSPSTLPREKIQMLINVFSKLPYDVLMKWDTNELAGTANNTKVLKWVPQSDILRHPKVKAFITQGGIQSFDEALTGGVPLVGIPLIGDQWYNVEMFSLLEIGVGLLMDGLTEDSLFNAVNTVIDDPKYRRNMVQLREKLRDQPQSGLERAVWWTEHVLRHKGASHLRAPTANMSWAEYLDLELMAVFAFAALIALTVAVITLYLFVKLIKSSLSKSVKLKVT